MAALMSAASASGDVLIATLGNGVRVVAIPLPHLESASVSVFVHSGSGSESRRESGISHFVEHMAFKGTTGRSCQQINLDAEQLGADVNAHTDKDHTAYHMRGLARDAVRFLHMLADIVRNSTFPEAELERERQVILHEYTEDEDDPLSTAYKLFDKMSFGTHPLAQPVIGTRRNIERFTRADLLAYVQRQYTAGNVIVGIAGNVDPDTLFREAELAFGSMPTGPDNTVGAPAYVGGVASKRQPGFSQTHLVLGFPIPSLREDHQAAVVAAALFGVVMSSPLMYEIRERRGLVYYAACSADVFDLSGQCVIEASTSPAQLDECVTEVTRLLAQHADRINPVDLERARNQIAVRHMRTHERPVRRLEAAVQDLFVFGRVRPRAELAEGIEGVTGPQVREAFERMLASRASVAVAGKVPAGTNDRIAERLAR